MGELVGRWYLVLRELRSKRWLVEGLLHNVCKRYRLYRQLLRIVGSHWVRSVQNPAPKGQLSQVVATNNLVHETPISGAIKTRFGHSRSIGWWG